MITKVTIKNFKSILDASATLSPFTLLIGANGSGKSNFLELLKEYSNGIKQRRFQIPKHSNHHSSVQLFEFENDKGITVSSDAREHLTIKMRESVMEELQDKIRKSFTELQNVSVYNINPANAGKKEPLIQGPIVQMDGSGVVQVLDSLKTGDREDLFDTIESKLSQFVPEIEKLSFFPGSQVKQLQVRERHISQPIPVSQLSDGTRLVLIILTILFQERKPSLICIEEIDRGLHPRLFGQIIELYFDLSKNENLPQIIATTHNPYLVDQFKDNESAVVIVEKEDGNTTFTTLEEKLNQLGPEEDPLGELWYSGFVGGVPK